MSKIFYIANIRLPTEKAHGIQIMEMCKAFADLGHEVELVVPNRSTPIAEDPFVYYDIPQNFSIKRLWSLNVFSLGGIGFWFQALTFAESTTMYTLFKNGIFYTRDELAAVLLTSANKKVVWEAHMGHTNVLIRLLTAFKTKIVVISGGLKDLYTKFGVPESNLWVAPDGVNIDQFDIQESKEDVREKLNFKKDEKIVLYTGHLYSWKGADVLAEAAKHLPEDIRIVFIGGTEKDIISFKEKYGSIKNISILGKKPHNEMPLYMRAADILTIPNSAKEDISRLYTSPMKLFEYMASGTPILASDLPSLREIIDLSTAYFFEPDNAESLAGTIQKIFGEYNVAQSKARQAFEEVKKYGWKERADNILNFI